MMLIDLAKEVAQEAGQLLKKGFGSALEIEEKEGKQNLVTQYDHLSQEMIIEKIKKKFPRHTILAEEAEMHTHVPTDEVLWIIDPLDGTVNFAHEIPFFAVSIAAYKKNEMIVGCVYNPLLDELFFAEKGSGAFLGEKKLSVSKQTSFEKAFTATGFPYDAYQNPLHCIERFGKMVQKGIPIRRLGVASLDICYIAAGRFDLFWEVALQPWDMAAGKLILEEAGGKVTHYDGNPHTIFSYSTFLGSNGHLHDKMVSLLKEDLL